MIECENNLENRTAYRALLFSTPGLNEYISGAICFEETLFASDANGTPLVELLNQAGIIPGIKVDKGAQPLFGTDGETVTQGITDLGKRCAEYYAQGARFSKWRAIIKISDSGCPSQLAIDQNAETLARYAAISQANGLVPIVEPEVLMDGSHSIQRAAEVCQRVFATCFMKLQEHNILLEGCMLKPNMVRKGTDNEAVQTPQDIAAATVVTLQRTVPPALPTICFLSGGMSEEDATVALNAINAYPGKKPWSLTFSYGRALQQSVLKAWKGDAANVEAAQAALIVRAKANSEAQKGIYAGGNADAAAAESLHVANYSY